MRQCFPYAPVWGARRFLYSNSYTPWRGSPLGTPFPGNDTWLRWRRTPDASHVFSATACRARYTPGPPCSTASRSCGHRSGPVTRLHGTPWLLAAPLFSCASAAGGLGFRKGEMAEGCLGRGSRRRRARHRCAGPPSWPAPPSSRCAPAAQATQALPLISSRLR